MSPSDNCYWKVTVERPLRLHSQLTHQAIETLRFASGVEEIRAALYEEFGDALFTDLGKSFGAIETRLRVLLRSADEKWMKDHSTRQSNRRRVGKAVPLVRDSRPRVVPDRRDDASHAQPSR